MRITTEHNRVSVSSIDLFSPSFYALGDPHEAWRTLRAESPVHWQQVDGDRGFWALTRYADVCDVLRRFRAFTSEHGNLLTTLGRGDAAGGKMLAVTDPPRHTQIKRQINSYFTHSAVAALEPQVRTLARRALAPGVHGEAFDLATAMAVYPIAFTALLLGINRADWARLRRFAYVAIADQDPEFANDSGVGRDLEQAHAEIFAYFMGEIREENIGRPDLTGAVARARLGNTPLSRAEQVYNLYSILLGATVTTAHAACAGMLALIENPGQFERWQRLGCTSSLVEEVLRWTSPANHFLRYARHDLKIGGTQIRAGEAVTVWLGSADRDEAVFADPYHFEVDREPNPHIAFGVGAHRCIGAPIARLALRILFDEVLRHVERFEAAGPVEHLASNFIAGIKRFPVRIVLKAGHKADFASVEPLHAP